jgi:hypothetical protein
MTKRKIIKQATTEQPDAGGVVDLRQTLNKKLVLAGFEAWIIGDTPLIVHAWSEKARREMLSKQVKAVRASGREARDPDSDFLNSFYPMKGGGYGFPVTGIKKAFLAAAHKDRGIEKTTTKSALFLDGEWTETKTAFPGASCNLPLVRIWGSKPVMREDMVKIGKGLSKIASLSYRGEFRVWAIRLTGKFNRIALKPEALRDLMDLSGIGVGVGEWRTERDGMFGAYHYASEAEEAAWNAFTKGGPLPDRALLAAAE